MSCFVMQNSLYHKLLQVILSCVGRAKLLAMLECVKASPRCVMDVLHNVFGTLHPYCLPNLSGYHSLLRQGQAVLRCARCIVILSATLGVAWLGRSCALLRADVSSLHKLLQGKY
jgi:hypothetical protein